MIEKQDTRNIFVVENVFSQGEAKRMYVVATTRQNGTHSMLTSAKLSVGYLVVEITRELNKEPLLYCYPIYISYK